MKRRFRLRKKGTTINPLKPSPLLIEFSEPEVSKIAITSFNNSKIIQSFLNY